MKKLASSTALATILLSGAAHADPAVMLGLALNFGGAADTKLGLTTKLLSDNRPDQLVGAIGGTYFFDGTWGLDVGIGYTFDEAAVTLSYDFINNAPQVAAGWANIETVC
ncbi:hypothetical protein SAMN06297129_2694 [Pseudooceanicola antarcticus]|nr:hypothetical protein [Pseudooceanicola antarcticus]SNY53984.1 hypothetical protein SAMN06297129_2694 [Pseudooceanicola antarcticus]